LHRPQPAKRGAEAPLDCFHAGCLAVANLFARKIRFRPAPWRHVRVGLPSTSGAGVRQTRIAVGQTGGNRRTAPAGRSRGAIAGRCPWRPLTAKRNRFAVRWCATVGNAVQDRFNPGGDLGRHPRWQVNRRIDRCDRRRHGWLSESRLRTGRKAFSNAEMIDSRLWLPAIVIRPWLFAARLVLMPSLG
jgi:hypothetical protein